MRLPKKNEKKHTGKRDIISIFRFL